MMPKAYSISSLSRIATTTTTIATFHLVDTHIVAGEYSPLVNVDAVPCQKVRQARQDGEKYLSWLSSTHSLIVVLLF